MCPVADTARMRARVRFAPPGATGVVEAGWLVGKTGRVDERRFHAWCLVLIVDGRGEHEACGRREAVGRGDLLLVRPDEPHAYGPPGGAAWTEVFLTCAGPVAEGLDRAKLLAPDDAEGRPLRVLSALPPTARGAFSAIADDFLAAGADADGVLLARVHLLLAGLAGRREEDSWTARAQRMLGSGLAAPLPPERVAAELGMPYGRFRRAFRAATGLAPAAYRLHCRLQAAKRILVERPDATLADIADATGFCSAFQLSRMFSRACGVSPSAFRAGRGVAS